MFWVADKKSKKYSTGFSIIELLVVIVVIAILAAIITVSYISLTGNAQKASVKSDLSNGVKVLEMYKVQNDAYPTTLGKNCPIGSTSACFSPSVGNELSYKPDSGTKPQNYNMTVKTTSGDVGYIVSNKNSVPASLFISPSDCPTNFVPVPGSITFGTAGFCVMKYEAKIDSGGKAVSVYSGRPKVSVSQTSAITYSNAACNGCHLISEAEWLTIAQNVLNQPANWVSGVVGSGQAYVGSTYYSSLFSLEAGIDDSNGYIGETNPEVHEKRTLALSNGQIIWDFSGNVSEWTSGQFSGRQPGDTGSGYVNRLWANAPLHDPIIPNPYPVGLGISSITDMSSGSQGLGSILSSATDLTLRGFVRSGYYGSGVNAGVLYLDLSNAPTRTRVDVGFRVAK